MPSGHPAPRLHGRQRECDALDRSVAAAKSGASRVLVLRGEAGVGKTALLEYVVQRSAGCRVARMTGAESELELAYAGLQQLCAPMLDRLERLPEPQRDALATAFGLHAGEPPNRFLVGLAFLNLLTEVAEEKPLLCIIDDAQWLDEATAQTLVFGARRLLAEPVALIVAVREPSGDCDFAGLDELRVEPLGDADSRAVLDSVLLGPVDDRVRDRIIAETHGNPLALLELPRGLSPVELAGGFRTADAGAPAKLLEQTFVRRLEPLPAATRQLLLTASADPLGDAALVWRAVDLQGIEVGAAAPAEAAGLIEFDTRVRFRHPLVRSAVYHAASPDERRRVHAALADVTDVQIDPDRRAWHRAQATAGLDEIVAAELERSAGRAQRRGGLAAAAAFLQESARLTPDPAARAERALGAAAAARDAGALDAALDLLVVVEGGPPDARRAAEVEHLRGQIAFDQRRSRDAAQLLRGAARQLEPLDTLRAREVHLESVGAAIWAAGLDGDDLVRAAAEAALAAPPPPDPPRVVDLLLDGFTAALSRGDEAGVRPMRRALAAAARSSTGTEDVGRSLWLLGNRAAGMIPLDLWDFDAWEDLANRQIRLAREAGALVQLQFALNFLGAAQLAAGDVVGAELALDEDRSIGEATGRPPVGYCAMELAALRGLEAEAMELIAGTVRDASARGQGRVVVYADYSRALLGNGLGRYEEARDAARRAFERSPFGLANLIVAELAEAASRTGDSSSAVLAAKWLADRVAITPTAWARGVESRVRALVSEGDAAEAAYRESIEQLAATRLRRDLARTQLLYGEWLRRAGRRVDARDQLRAAHDLFTAMRADAFAERARHELLATGETVRKRTDDTRDALTPQEQQIAQLASSGLSNPEIGAQLFISARTVEWHLRKVFTKLAIASRKELRAALAPG